MGIHEQFFHKFPVTQESGEAAPRFVGGGVGARPPMPPKTLLGLRCPQYQEVGLNLRSYVCRECAGFLLIRSTVHRLRPLLAGNGAENFAELRFQPHLIPHPSENHNPHLDAWLRQAPSVLEIGEITSMSVAPPNVVVAPDHKCIHGVSWGADNCRVCRELVYTGKKARLIWEAIRSRKIRTKIRPKDGHLFTLDGSANPKAGFVLVKKREIDAVLGVKDFIDPQELRRYRDIIIAATRNVCIECGALIDRELNYCQDCARGAVMDSVNRDPEVDMEYVQTRGRNARFSETKPQPLSNRNIDFNLVRLVARTFICGVLSDATGEEISSLDDEGFMELCQWSPPMMALLQRFCLYTHDVPLADIASLEGVGRKGIERYFERWTRIINSVISPLS